MNTATTTGLQVQGLACRRQDHLLFEDLNFSVGAGQVLEICGVNGSGKTTLLRLLSGLRQPDAGSIIWDGLPLTKAAYEYRKQLAYLGHRSGLNADLSAAENLRLEAAMFGMDDSSIQPALAELGLTREQHIPCRLLSAGQRQRVSLSRLCMRSVRLWILDEPVASLDRQAQQQVHAMLDGHVRAGGSVIFTTHQPLSNLSVDVQQLFLGEGA